MIIIKHREEEVYDAVRRGDWKIDDVGRIWRVAIRTKRSEQRKCKPRRAEKPATRGYLRVSTRIDRRSIDAFAHRLVWFHFHGPIADGLTVNHKNGDKTDNRPDNLELATPLEQLQHAIHVLKKRVGGPPKLTPQQVADIRERLAHGEFQSQIAKRHGICQATVSEISLGHTYRDV